MSIETIRDKLLSKQLSLSEVKDLLADSESRRLLNYFLHRNVITREPMSDSELLQLQALVSILSILYNSEVDSPVSDDQFETLTELLIDAGQPRITSDIAINDDRKVEHNFPNLRGSLDKVHYLSKSEKQSNPSRKYLDDWIKSKEIAYQKATGKKINLNEELVTVQCKFDGLSAVMQVDPEGIITWITRGDTKRNLARDVSHVMRQFNSVFATSRGLGIKFEVLVSEEDKETINLLYQEKPYAGARQIVSAVLNSNEVDFKADYLHPIPLRMMTTFDDLEFIHMGLLDYPHLTCKLSEREKIREFLEATKAVKRLDKQGGSFHTDGIVITLRDTDICRALGRDDSINAFEVCIKRSDEFGYTTVKDVEFEVGLFGNITPVVLFQEVILNGSTLRRATLSNKARFDELALRYQDLIRVELNIIPMISVDDYCLDYNSKQQRKKVNFPKYCPSCGSDLELNVIMVKCTNSRCHSQVIGRIYNWCDKVGIANLGYQTLQSLYTARLLDKGIRSLYKLKNKLTEVEDVPGFGKQRTRQIVAEIESKRFLPDYLIFGAFGIEGLAATTFKLIFQHLPYTDLLADDLTLLPSRLLDINGIGPEKSKLLISFFSDKEKVKEMQKLLEELRVEITYGTAVKASKGEIVFSGFRPTDVERRKIEENGYVVGDSLTKRTTILAVPDPSYRSDKVTKANKNNIIIIYKESPELKAIMD